MGIIQGYLLISHELLSHLRIRPEHVYSVFDKGWNAALPSDDHRKELYAIRDVYVKNLIPPERITDDFDRGWNAAIEAALELPVICVAKNDYASCEEQLRKEMDMSREIKIMERVKCPGGMTMKWVSTVNHHAGLASECFDKNDNEIFEGHILRIKRGKLSKSEESVVTFSDGAFWVQLSMKWGGKCINVPLYQLAEDDGVSLEIIGHVLDDPEIVDLD